ncbi:translocator protein 2 isoform X2 [Cynocephalus volans]|uniref:translocator protein 2 isoform X2 n=1 Tax=Cynocephalus volans TaxID=110931 RepID=UPI002FCBA002
MGVILPPQGECGPHGAIFMVLPHLGLILVWLFTHKQMSGWCEGPRSLPWCPLHKVLLLIRTTIYSVMGYASYLVWKDLGKGFGRPLALPLGLYAAQLVISWIIPILFFRAHSPGLALLLLYRLVVSTVLIWHPTNHLAVLLQLPCLAWLTVTTAITYHLWRDRLCPAQQPQPMGKKSA